MSNLKPSAVIAVVGEKSVELYQGLDPEKAVATFKDARGKYPVIWSSIKAKGWTKWKGAVTDPPVTEKPKRAYTKRI